jgi:hypothetical protein
MAVKRRVLGRKKRALIRMKRRIFFIEIGISAMIGGFFLYQYIGQYYGVALLAKLP